MEHNRRYILEQSQGNPARTEEEETQTTGSINKQQHNQSGQKKQELQVQEAQHPNNQLE